MKIHISVSDTLVAALLALNVGLHLSRGRNPKENRGAGGSSSANYTFKADPRIVLDMARTRLQNQLGFADALDTKLGSSFAASSALVGLLATILAFRSAADSSFTTSGSLGEYETGLLITAAILYIAALVCVIAAFPRNWRTGPSVEVALTESQEIGQFDFVAKQIERYQRAWKLNKNNNQLKQWALRISFFVTASETALVIAAVWPLIS